MRSLNPFAAHHGVLIGPYAAKLAEAVAVHKAEAQARVARAEAELAIKARSEFLQNMNHELRTPLNAIIGFTTMLRDSDVYPVDEEQRRVYAEYILQSADLLLGHINTILEVAALDSGDMALEKDEADLAKLLDGAILRAGVAAASAGVRIDNKTNLKDGAVCWCDAARVSQAVDHLLRTAIGASPKGARILVRVTIGGNGWPEVAIRDKGTGLEPEAIKKALTAFDEVHRGLNRSFSGPGVGYAIAKTFIEMQGGRFRLESRPGMGTLAHIALPPVQAKPEENKPDDAAMRLAG